VFAAALLVFSWRIGIASPWRDEVVSAVVARRSPGDILALARHVDLVHATYYLEMHFLAGTTNSVLELRHVSAAFLAGAVAMTFLIGRRLASTWVGYTAAALCLISPFASRYAQEARPYALVTLISTVSTLLLIEVSDSNARRRPHTVAYAASLVVLGLLNTLALMLVAAHVAYLTSSSRGARRAAAKAMGAAAVCLAPFLVGTLSQSGQVDWLARPNPTALLNYFGSYWGSRSLGVLALLLPVAALTVRLPPRLRSATMLAVAWAATPPLILWGVSQFHPFFDQRYLVYCLPGEALAGAVLLRIFAQFVPSGCGPIWRHLAVVVVLVTATVTSTPRQLAIRGPVGHSEDLRGVATTIERIAGPREPVLFDPDNFRLIALAYPGKTRRTWDVGLCVSGASSATLVGLSCSPRVLSARLLGASSVLLIDRNSGSVASGDMSQRVLLEGFTLGQTWTVGGFRVSRLVRTAALP
jgi:mannosyltransferase